jgi:hypothetical protein
LAAARTETIRTLLIASSVIAALLILVIGVPRALAMLTPRVERVWVVSAALGDSVASHTPREVPEGTPVTLYAVLEARPWLSDETRLYGQIDAVVLGAGESPRPVESWSGWWLTPEFLWLKVEPTLSFANGDFDPEFRIDQIAFTDSYQIAWGFGWNHAADISPTSDDYPGWNTGTMRFAARVVLRDHRDRILQQVTAPSSDALLASEPRDRPHRVTVRGGDDPFGRMRGYAGLPYVQMVGEVPPERHPTTLYLGGTILDFWVAGLRDAGQWSGGYLPWERLEDRAEVIVDDMFLATDGSYYYSADPLRAVDWSTVRPGDLVTIDDHVGVLLEDRGPGGGGDGVLSRWDRILNAYFEPLRENEMGEAFHADIRIYRLVDEGIAGTGR